MRDDEKFDVGSNQAPSILSNGSNGWMNALQVMVSFDNGIASRRQMAIGEGEIQ